MHKDEFKIHGATAPIYLVRKVDIGCRIGALVIVRSNISSNDFVHGDEKKKKKSKILATFKSEMSDVVYMESDHVDEDCYADDTPGEGRKIGKNWRLQQKSKTSSTTVAVAETPHKHPHSIGKSFFSSSKVTRRVGFSGFSLDLPLPFLSLSEDSLPEPLPFPSAFPFFPLPSAFPFAGVD